MNRGLSRETISENVLISERRWWLGLGWQHWKSWGMVEFLMYSEVRADSIYYGSGREEGKLKRALRFGPKAMKIEIGKSMFWGRESCQGWWRKSGLVMPVSSKERDWLQNQGTMRGLWNHRSLKRENAEEVVSQEEVRMA